MSPKYLFFQKFENCPRVKPFDSVWLKRPYDTAKAIWAGTDPRKPSRLSNGLGSSFAKKNWRRSDAGCDPEKFAIFKVLEIAARSALLCWIILISIFLDFY